MPKISTSENRFWILKLQTKGYIVVFSCFRRIFWKNRISIMELSYLKQKESRLKILHLSKALILTLSSRTMNNLNHLCQVQELAVILLSSVQTEFRKRFFPCTIIPISKITNEFDSGIIQKQQKIKSTTENWMTQCYQKSTKCIQIIRL